MSFIQAAFEQVCKEAKPAEGHYVVLMERIPFYGGPQEGGWWGEDCVIRAYQYFSTEEQAQAAYDRVEQLAAELETESRQEYGEACLREMEWLDARGLDADYLPEPDGPSEFYVLLCDELPQEYYGCRHWE